MFFGFFLRVILGVNKLTKMRLWVLGESLVDPGAKGRLQGGGRRWFLDPKGVAKGRLQGGGRRWFLGPGGDYRGGTSKPGLDNQMNGYLDIWRIG